jgi:putative transposase
LKLRKLHQKVKNQRADYQHKVSTRLIKTYDVICIEKLNLAGMVKSYLGKTLSDVAIGNFYNMLIWKAERAARTVVEVPARFTSQTCSGCGHCEKANRKTQADFECVKCSHKINADISAAQNIFRLGINRLDVTYNIS